MSKTVQCLLCPFQCTLNNNERGICQVRANINGKLISLVYGKAAAMHIDPIEKKPVFHLYPGSQAFSIATIGCNLGCKFCQNWQLSQTKPEEADNTALPPEQVVSLARQYKCASIAYTYSDPVVFYEYTYDTAVLAHEKNIKNILVSAGFINAKPMRKLARVTDAANIDLKSFSNDFYRDICCAALKPVLRTLEICLEENVLLEITNLIVPALNDDPKLIKKMCEWIYAHLGAHIPLHFSRFYPMYLLKDLPPTPADTLIQAKEIAHDAGLQYVYVGNIYVKNSENTYCPNCKKLLVERYGYTILSNIIVNNSCPDCKTHIYGIWS